MNMFQVAVIIVSDRCFRGERADEGGPHVVHLLEEQGFLVAHTALTPGDRLQIEAALRHAADRLDMALVVTVGGTGFSPRDVAPEATAAVCERMVPGIPEAMRTSCLAITPRAMLSRAAAGIRGRTLILNLPGSPRAAEENLMAVAPALAHGLAMLRRQ